MANRFRIQELRDAYDSAVCAYTMRTPPLFTKERHPRPTRNNAFGGPFWNGFRGVGALAFPGTTIYAVWRAGQDMRAAYDELNDALPVESTNIATVAYSKALRMLRLTFRNGRVYDYQNISPALINGLWGAASHGEYLHRYIIRKPSDYPAREVTAELEVA